MRHAAAHALIALDASGCVAQDVDNHACVSHVNTQFCDAQQPRSSHSFLTDCQLLSSWRPLTSTSGSLSLVVQQQTLSKHQHSHATKDRTSPTAILYQTEHSFGFITLLHSTNELPVARPRIAQSSTFWDNKRRHFLSLVNGRFPLSIQQHVLVLAPIRLRAAYSIQRYPGSNDQHLR